MEQAYTLTVFAHDNSDITDIIGEICHSTRTHSAYEANPDLAKIKSLVIKKGDDEKSYKLSSPPFFIYGGLGIVFGLNDFDDGTGVASHSGIQYVLKVDCPQPQTDGQTHFGLVMKTAISINDRFGQYPEEQYNMAHSYGTLSTEPRTFAIYKYNGEELGTIIYGSFFGKRRNEGLVKDILRNVILGLRRFNSKFLLHGDFCTENLVIKRDTREVVLVDLDTMTDLTKLSESKECIFRLYDENERDIFEICPIPKPANKVGCVTYPRAWGRSLVPHMTELFKFSPLEKKSFSGGHTVPRNSSNTVKTLMMADRFGLFWVIIKILLTSSGYGEEQIEQFFGVDFQSHSTYTTFYDNIKKSHFRDKVISLIRDITMLREKTKYITSEHFEDFIRLLLDLIKEDFSIDNIAAFDALLNHQFLRVPEEGQSQLQDQLPPTLQVQEQSPPVQAPPVQASAGGSHKKKRRPARINRRTKKRNTRNKQNRQNRTKRGQSKQARK
jgi:hypothetical protein